MKKYLYELATDRRKGFPHNIIAILLRLCSLIFWAAVVVRRFFYRMGILRSHRLPNAVISVGNITVGGTGKTPLIEYLLEVFRSRKRKVVVLTRGYMDRSRGQEPGQSNDEADMLRHMFPDAPILVGQNRLENAREYLKGHAVGLFILDDGFQHLKIRRNLDIVVIDAMNPWGNGFLLPGGILREPKEVLRYAGIAVLTKTDLAPENIEGIKSVIRSINPRAMIVETTHEPVAFIDVRTDTVMALEKARNTTVYALSSIGNPDSFEKILSGLDIGIQHHVKYADHHVYSQNDIEDLVSLCQDNNLTVITTQKDAVKIKYFLDDIPPKVQLFSLKIRIKITSNEEVFLERINHIL